MLNDAERFNIAATDEKPVSNEGIEATVVTVVAKEGAVVINGAQGKKVVITNILGQTIANTVLSSSSFHSLLLLPLLSVGRAGGDLCYVINKQDVLLKKRNDYASKVHIGIA